MATLVEIDNLVNGYPLLKQRFKAARLKAAWDILNEGDITFHEERLAWASGIINNYDVDLSVEYLLFLSNPTIQTSGNASTDNDIQFVVNSFVDVWAG